MDKKDFDRLYQPTELSVIKNRNLNCEYDLINNIKTTRTEEKHLNSLLKITLYKQYLDQISYHGSLEDAPVITKTKK